MYYLCTNKKQKMQLVRKNMVNIDRTGATLRGGIPI